MLFLDAFDGFVKLFFLSYRAQEWDLFCRKEGLNNLGSACVWFFGSREFK